MTLSTSATADHIYATGLRNQWHPVLPSSFVAPGAMRRVTVLGEQWLLFRRADGTLALLADRCPHRGAPLSLGKHLGDRVACRYHGVEVATDGTVSSVPGLPGCALEGRRLVASLPVREVAGAVLAYFGDERHPEPIELTVPEPLDDPGIEPILCYAEWQAPWRYIMENLLDPMHGAFLHRESHTMYDGDTTAKFRIRETDRGYFCEKTDQRGVNFDWVELCRTGVDWVDLSIPYPPSAGPGGAFGIVGMVCPVDAERTGVFFWRYRRVSGWQRDTRRFLYRTLIEERHWAVLEQDRVLLEALPADADRHEHLYQHDLGVVRLRRLLRARAERQSASAPPE
ncbi:Rieske 2Fe-2S domain-containing protein [Streptomyces noursei]|uniref:Rieske 2Fe-2S domain-containing protein n=1 Tax=Streptomyces noursei TaxID=1971 RepID=UPI00167462C1|nr:Rieske 2Fe-2S domain-containing protein [Streptomyces noursei]MCZ1014227.1 Rieske 2Fe-2S domain-containing protein [Streptomyces noursei]GGX23446.1 3-phenylpropionate dioxygenase [Streptomyces noursei]